MKALKKIIKILAIVGAIAGIVKVVMRVLNLTKRMNDYNEKAIFSGKDIKYQEEPFEKDSVASLFSGVNLDFKNATMADKTSQLDILGRYSGISVKVPKHWHIEMDGTAVQSGIDQRFIDNSEDEEAPKLQINYDIKYCGLSIANPKDEELEETEESEESEDTLVLESDEDQEEEIIIEDVVDEIPSEMSEETLKVIEEFEENFHNEEDETSEDDEEVIESFEE